MRYSAGIVALIFVAESVPTVATEYVKVANEIELDSGPDSVIDLTRSLGAPRVRYEWCRGVDCEDRDSEAGATEMTAGWMNGGIEQPSAALVITFCRGAGEWHVGSVQVFYSDGKRTKFGTQPTVTDLVSRYGESFFDCRNGLREDSGALHREEPL